MAEGLNFQAVDDTVSYLKLPSHSISDFDRQLAAGILSRAKPAALQSYIEQISQMHNAKAGQALTPGDLEKAARTAVVHADGLGAYFSTDKEVFTQAAEFFKSRIDAYNNAPDPGNAKPEATPPNPQIARNTKPQAPVSGAPRAHPNSVASQTHTNLPAPPASEPPHAKQAIGPEQRNPPNRQDASSAPQPGKTAFEFGTNSWTLSPKQKQEIGRIAQQWKNGPQDKMVLVEGHTDTMGSTAANDVMARQRALATRDELIKNGVPADHIVAVGYNKNDTANLLERTADNLPYAPNRSSAVSFVGNDYAKNLKHDGSAHVYAAGDKLALPRLAHAAPHAKLKALHSVQSTPTPSAGKKVDIDASHKTSVAMQPAHAARFSALSLG